MDRLRVNQDSKSGQFTQEYSQEEARIREEARTRGEKYYLFSRPCKRGHMSKRAVRNTECYKCHLLQGYARKAERTATERAFSLYNFARQRAKGQGVAFRITQRDIEAIWPVDNKCPILGVEFKRNTGQCGPRRESPSLDRIKPEQGYVPGNIAVISYKANCMKQNETNPEIFEAMARWLRAQQ